MELRLLHPIIFSDKQRRATPEMGGARWRGRSAGSHAMRPGANHSPERHRSCGGAGEGGGSLRKDLGGQEGGDGRTHPDRRRLAEDAR